MSLPLSALVSLIISVSVLFLLLRVSKWRGVVAILALFI